MSLLLATTVGMIGLGVGGLVLAASKPDSVAGGSANEQGIHLAANSLRVGDADATTTDGAAKTAVQSTPVATSTSASSAAAKSATNSAAATPAKAVTPAAPSLSWRGTALYVDQTTAAAKYIGPGASQINRLGQQPTATWFGDWNTNVAADVSAYVSQAAAAHAMPVLVAYNIPNRDCGGYSSGGAPNEAAYAAWINQFASGIGNRPAVVILEPDALNLQVCLNGDQLAARNRELSNAVATLGGLSQTRVYLDAGHSGWLSAANMAGRLQAAGLSAADGFALNISNFGTTASNTAYGTQIAALTGGKHFIIDTSRNGNGPTADDQWCNPAGRALGAAPTSNTGNGLIDAYLWIKTPWQSDGSCNGHPAAGQNDWDYALSLAQNAGW